MHKGCTRSVRCNFASTCLTFNRARLGFSRDNENRLCAGIRWAQRRGNSSTHDGDTKLVFDGRLVHLG